MNPLVNLLRTGRTERLLLNVTGFLILAASVSACGPSGLQERKRNTEIPVRVVEVSVTENTGVRSYVGTTSPVKSTYLSCRYPGKLVSIAVSQGDVVKKGDTIAVIESQTVINAREMAYATLKQAEDGYRRATEVHGSGSIADVKMVEIETQLAKARTAARTADKALEDCTVKAPFDGVIGEVLVDEGIELSAVDNIARIMDISEVEIHFPVPEGEIAAIAVGSEAAITIPALGIDNLPGKVSSKGIVASALSHTYDCTLLPLKKTPELMPGMVCKVYIACEGSSGVIIPASAIRTDISGRYVWVVEDGIVGRAGVLVGGFSGKGVVITDGLGQGDKVIVEGTQKVSTGMKVRTVE